MREIGIDVAGQWSKSVDEFLDQEFDYVITVCDVAKESCPVFLVQRRNCTGVSRILLMRRHAGLR
jgi:protein-tyrosine-phosphatase